MGRWPQRHRDAASLEERRRNAVALYRKGIPQAAVARQVAVSPQAVNQWVQRSETKGEAALRALPRPGRPPQVPRETQATLASVLAKGTLTYGYSTDLWTLPRIVDVMEKEWGVRYSQSRMWDILRAHRLSWQRPRRQAREKDLEAVKRWKRYSWPRYKKKPGESAPS
jgi:transposase